MRKPFDTRELGLRALLWSFSLCLAGMLVAVGGHVADVSWIAQLGGIMTIPLTLMLGLPILFLVAIGPLIPLGGIVFGIAEKFELPEWTGWIAIAIVGAIEIGWLFVLYGLFRYGLATE